jgi:hypothetical protein
LLQKHRSSFFHSIAEQALALPLADQASVLLPHQVHPQHQASLLLLKHSCFHTPITPVHSSTRVQEHLPFSYLVSIGTPTPGTTSVSSPYHLLFSTTYCDFGQHAHRLHPLPPKLRFLPTTFSFIGLWRTWPNCFTDS